MQIKITGIHIEITSAISDYVHQKFDIIKKYTKDDYTSMLAVEIAKTTEHHAHGDIYKINVLLVKKGKDTALEVVTDDVYKGIDLMKDKLTRELSDEKDKRLSLFKKGAKHIKNLLKRN